MSKTTTINTIYNADDTPDRCYLSTEVIDGDLDSFTLMSEDNGSLLVSGANIELYMRAFHALLGQAIEDLDNE